MGSSTANSGGSHGGGERDRNQQNKVNKQIALVKAADTAKKNAIAAGNEMYGGVVSQAVNEEMVNQQLAKVGSYFIQEGGNFIRTDKEGFKAAKLAGKKVSKSYQTTSEGRAMKYGQSGGAMGSGDHTGVMTSTSISQKMLQKQNKIKGALVGALSLVAPVGGNLMRLDAAKSLKDVATPGKAHKEYKEQFKAKMSGKKPPPKSNIVTDTLGGINKLKATLGGS